MPVDPTDPDLPLYGAAPLTAYARFWRRYAVFSGRASLSEYWWAVLLNVVAGVALGLLGAILLAFSAALADSGFGAAAVPRALGAVLLFALVVFVLAQLVPSIAIAVRRLHDANLSGLFVLVGLIPSVGGLVLLVLSVLPSSPEGRRFDRGASAWQAAAWQPAASQPSLASEPPPAASPINGGFDGWPAPASSSTTAPPPVSGPADFADSADSADDALLGGWQRLGEVERVEPKLEGQPAWRQLGYVLVRRSDGIDVLATDGLSRAEGAAAPGAGAEVYLPGQDLGASADAVADGWRFPIVAAVAQRIAAGRVHLPTELQQYGALSMSVPADAPEGWRNADGAVGVLVGVGLPGVPETLATAAGEVRLVGLTLLRPDELQRILAQGAEARTAIASRLAALPPAQLTSPARTAL